MSRYMLVWTLVPPRPRRQTRFGLGHRHFRILGLALLIMLGLALVNSQFTVPRSWRRHLVVRASKPYKSPTFRQHRLRHQALLKADAKHEGLGRLQRIAPSKTPPATDSLKGVGNSSFVVSKLMEKSPSPVNGTLPPTDERIFKFSGSDKSSKSDLSKGKGFIFLNNLLKKNASLQVQKNERGPFKVSQKIVSAGDAVPLRVDINNTNDKSEKTTRSLESILHQPSQTPKAFDRPTDGASPSVTQKSPASTGSPKLNTAITYTQASNPPYLVNMSPKVEKENATSPSAKKRPAFFGDQPQPSLVSSLAVDKTELEKPEAVQTRKAFIQNDPALVSNKKQFPLISSSALINISFSSPHEEETGLKVPLLNLLIKPYFQRN
ncbi:uncharacterized protein LOC101858964 [Aplysia californica]|uniref:Uncharacterized protein LOC101858964 n=1 Tax=Aplysia californica TaxID=6500 RepID=A0ABM0K1S4_APLCA|nr:uncharacterized protein LOC101858964 [Aplysia californica]